MKRQIFYLLLILYIFIPHPSYAQDTVFLGSISADKGIDSIALLPNTGVAYGISKEEKSVYIFDLENYLVKNRVELNKKPRAIAVNPLNNLAYVTSDSGEGFLYIIDSDGNILNTIEILKDPRGIAINPDNNTAVIAIEKDRKLLILSVASDTVTVTNEIPLHHRPRLISLDTDSNRAVVVAAKAEGEGKQNQILVVDLNTGNVIYNIELERKIKGIAVDIEKDIAVATTKENINLIDINTMDVLKTIDAKHAYGVDINQSTHKAVIGYKKRGGREKLDSDISGKAALN